MTAHILIGDVRPRVQYVGNGAQTAFPYPFPVFAADDLRVYLNDTQATSGFTVSGAGSSDGGTVSFTDPPGDGVRVTLLRRLDIARVTDFLAGGPLRADTLNDALDYLTAVSQQLDADISRAVRLAPGGTDSATTTLPSPKAGALIGWDESATALVNDPVNTAAITARIAEASQAAVAAITVRADEAELLSGDAAMSARRAGLDGAAARAAATTAEAWADLSALTDWTERMNDLGVHRRLLVAGSDPYAVIGGGTADRAAGTVLTVVGEASLQGLGYVAARFAVASATAGAAVTLDLADGEMQALTLTADTAVTLPDPPAGTGYSLTLKLIQDATGGRAPTLSQADTTAAVWLAGAAPAWRTAAGAFDVVVVTHDGTDLMASCVGGHG
jgi:hypothetical protein